MTKKQKIQAMFLDYVNNFVTVASFAEYHNIELNTAHRIINIGRTINNK